MTVQVPEAKQLSGSKENVTYCPLETVKVPLFAIAVPTKNGCAGA